MPRGLRAERGGGRPGWRAEGVPLMTVKKVLTLVWGRLSCRGYTLGQLNRAQMTLAA